MSNPTVCPDHFALIVVGVMNAICLIVLGFCIDKLRERVTALERKQESQ